MLIHQTTTGLGSYVLFSEENQDQDRFIQVRTDAYDRVFHPSSSGASSLSSFLCYLHLTVEVGWPKWKTETFAVTSVAKSLQLPYRRALGSVRSLLSIGLVDVELHRFRATTLSVVEPTAVHHVLHDPARPELFRQLSMRGLRELFASVLSWDAKSFFVGLLLVSDTSTGAYRSTLGALRERFSMGYLRCRRVLDELVTSGHLIVRRDHLGATLEIPELPSYLVSPRSGNSESRTVASEIALRYGIKATPQLIGVLQRCLAAGISRHDLLRWLDLQGSLAGSKSPTAVVVSRLTRLNRDLTRSPGRKGQQGTTSVTDPTEGEVGVSDSPVLLHDLDRKDYERFVRFVSDTLPILPAPSTLGLSHHMSQRYKLCAATVEAACWSAVTGADDDADHGYLLQSWAHQVDPDHCPPPSVASTTARWQDSTPDSMSETIASRYAALIH